MLQNLQKQYSMFNLMIKDKGEMLILSLFICLFCDQ